MPWRPRRRCATHNLRLPVGAPCPACAAAYDQRRPGHFAFYTGAEWRTLRAQVLAEEPRCAVCREPATDVDHILPRRVRPDLALVRNNCRSLCASCHGRVTRGQGPPSVR